jgi:hypothetical protein
LTYAGFPPFTVQRNPRRFFVRSYPWSWAVRTSSRPEPIQTAQRCQGTTRCLHLTFDSQYGHSFPQRAHPPGHTGWLIREAICSFPGRRSGYAQRMPSGPATNSPRDPGDSPRPRVCDPPIAQGSQRATGVDAVNLWATRNRPGLASGIGKDSTRPRGTDPHPSPSRTHPAGTSASGIAERDTIRARSAAVSPGAPGSRLHPYRPPPRPGRLGTPTRPRSWRLRLTAWLPIGPAMEQRAAGGVRDTAFGR